MFRRSENGGIGATNIQSCCMTNTFVDRQCSSAALILNPHPCRYLCRMNVMCPPCIWVGLCASDTNVCMRASKRSSVTVVALNNDLTFSTYGSYVSANDCGIWPFFKRPRAFLVMVKPSKLMIKSSLYMDAGREPSTDDISSVVGADGVGDVVTIMVSRSLLISFCPIWAAAVIGQWESVNVCRSRAVYVSECFFLLERIYWEISFKLMTLHGMIMTVMVGTVMFTSSFGFPLKHIKFYKTDLSHVWYEENVQPADYLSF